MNKCLLFKHREHEFSTGAFSAAHFVQINQTAVVKSSPLCSFPCVLEVWLDIFEGGATRFFDFDETNYKCIIQAPFLLFMVLFCFFVWILTHFQLATYLKKKLGCIFTFEFKDISPSYQPIPISIQYRRQATNEIFMTDFVTWSASNDITEPID